MILEYNLNEFGYVIYNFDVNFSLYVFLLIAYYLLFTLYLFYTMEMLLDKSKFEQFSYLSSKWIIKLWRQLTMSVMHLAQKLLMNIKCSGGSRSFAK